MRQDYSDDDLQQLLNRYEGAGLLETSSLYTSGFENSNHYVKTNSGEYVIKIFEGTGVSNEQIVFEVVVMDASYRAGVKTPRVIRNVDGELVTSFGGKLAILMEHIKGENMEMREVSDRIVKEVGEEVGKMDGALSGLHDGSRTRQDYAFDLKNFLMLEQYVGYLPLEFDRDLFQNIFGRFRELKPRFNRLPQGLIHNDVALHNCIVYKGKLAGIVDFSDLAFSPYIQNIAVTMAQMIFCYNWKPHQASLLIQEYRKHRSLSGGELALLYDLTLTRYATFIIEFVHWDVDSGVDSKRRKAERDFYGFAQRFRAFGRERFNKLIGITV